MRTLVDIPDDDLKWLDLRAKQQGKSRAALVREAVSNYRATAFKSGIEQAFGSWKDRTDIGDSVEWQRRERAGWTRPWDDDYEDVKAEFPDLFDEEDDRQREIYLQMRAAHEAAGKRKRA